MEFVFNEWFIEYMVPGSGHQSMVWQLLDTVEAKGDCIVVRRDSPFTRKFYRFSKELTSQVAPLFKRFRSLMYNSTTVRMVYEHEIQNLPEALVQTIPRKDVYLAELAAASAHKTIVTTDTPLRDSLDGKEGFRVFLAEDFFEFYAKGDVARRDQR